MAFDVEQFFQSIDIILTQRLANLSYDKTVIATVVDDSDKKNGHYFVSDGTVKFDAYSSDAEYKIDDQVRITILNGDWDQKKFIAGKYTGEENNSTPLIYVSPLSTTMQSAASALPTNGSWTLKSNGAITKKPVWSLKITEDSDFYALQTSGVYNVLTLQGDFQTLFNEEPMSGEYGLLLELFITPEANSKQRIKQFVAFSSNEMLGNPYSYKIDSRQSKKVLVAPGGIVTEVILSVYQGLTFDVRDGQMTEGDNKFISRDGTPIGQYDINFKNIAVGFGSDLTQITDDSLQIYTVDSSTYHYANGVGDSTNDKRIGLVWYNKTDADHYVGFSDGVIDVKNNNIVQYDEIDYMKQNEEYLRLEAHMGHTGIPNDTISLGHAADITESENHMINAYKALTSGDLLRNLRNIRTLAEGSGDGEISLNDELNPIISTTAQGESILSSRARIAENATKALVKRYWNVLQYGYNVQHNLGNSDWNTSWNVDNTLTGYYFDTYISAMNEALTAVVDFMNYMGKETDKGKPFSAQRGIYDTYNSKVRRNVESIRNILSLIKVSGEKERSLSDYQTRTNYVPHTSNNLSEYDNRYCIYWFRYDAKNPLTYITPVPEAEWKKDEEYETYQDYLLGCEKNNEEYRYGQLLGPEWRRVVVDSNNNEVVNLGLPNHIGKTIDVEKEDGTVVAQTFLPPSPNEHQYLHCKMSPVTGEEKYKAVLFYNHKMFVSNELTFINTEADLIPDEFAVSNGDGLVISHGANSQSHYAIYSSAQDLMDIADEHRSRTLRVSYRGENIGDEALAGAGIYWYVPMNSTMLTYDRSYLTEKLGFVTDEFESTEFSKPGYIYFYKQIGYTEEVVDVEDLNGNPIKKTIYHLNEDDRTFVYKVKPFYDTSAQNNTILVEAHIHGENEEKMRIVGEMFFTFSIFGSNGTKYTFTITPATAQNAVLPDKPLDVNLALRDASGELLPLNYEPTFEPGEEQLDMYHLRFKWHARRGDGVGNLTMDPAPGAEDPQIRVLTVPNRYDATGYVGIIGAEVSYLAQGNNGSKDRIITLDALYPVPYSADDNYYISGPTMIVYNNQGVVSRLSEEPFRLYSRFGEDGEKDNSVLNQEWSLVYYDNEGHAVGNDPEDAEVLKYLPKLNNDNTLMPATMYFHYPNGLFYVPVAQCRVNGELVWAQPIVITQNRYASSTLNDWDGQFTIDEENGTILSTMIGAGRKMDDNSFEGVLMGDIVAGANFDPNNASGIGIYGFHEGSQSFHVGVDGTAFIGKSGRGRVSFDGNNGFIYSGNWINSFEDGEQPFKTIFDENQEPIGKGLNRGKAGMAIDLQEGHIDAYDFRLTSNGVKLDGNALGNEYYVDISNNNENIAEEIRGKYYIRFRGDGKLELSLADADTWLGDKGKTLVGYIDERDTYIIDDIIGLPEDLIGQQTVYTYINAIEYLNQENIFNKLTDNGENKGIYPIYDENGKIIELYINATYIATGILRSNNWNGILTNTSNGQSYDLKNMTAAEIEAIDWSGGNWALSASEGTYWNLNDGKMWAANFELNAWDNRTQTDTGDATGGGLYLNSNPANDGFYLSIGKTGGDNPHFIQYGANGDLKMRMNDFVLDAFDNTSEKGLYLNSSPEQGEYWFTVGEPGNFIQFKNGTEGLVIQINNNFTLNAVDENGKGIYLNSNPVSGGNFFQVGDGTHYLQFTEDGGFYINVSGTNLFLVDKDQNIIDYIQTKDDAVLSEVKDNIIGKVPTGDEFNAAWSEGLTVYDNIAAQIGRVEEQLIGIDPKDPTAKTLPLYSYIDAEEYLTVEGVFNGLTNGGEKKGIYALDANGNIVTGKPEAGTIKDLYINASYIATGILRSSNWQGTIKTSGGSSFTSVESYESAMKRNPALKDQDTWLEAVEGTYWDLNKGQLWAANFELNAWKSNNSSVANVTDSSKGKGIYFNSDPRDGGCYFTIGDTLSDNPTFIQYTKDGELIMSLTNFLVDAWDNTNHRGLYLNSRPTASDSDYYFKLGHEGYGFLEYTGNHSFRLNTAKFVLDAWNNRDDFKVNADGSSVSIDNAHGVYINSDPAPGGYYFSIGEEGNYIQLQAPKNSDPGKLTLQSQYFVLDAWREIRDSYNNLVNGGVYVNSNPQEYETGVDCYLKVGTDDNYLAYTGDHKLLLNLTDFALHAWDENNNKGIYINSDPKINQVNPDGTPYHDYYLSVGDGTDFIQLGPENGLSISTKKLVLDAWKNDGAKRETSGVYLNSSPDDDGAYFSVGNVTDFIQLFKDDGLIIKTRNLNLDAWSNNSGIQLMSNPPSGGYYFRAGNETNYMTYNDDGVLKIKGHIEATSGSIGNWSITSGAITGPNGYTTLSADGKITATDVDLSGTIKATAGEVGGWVIGANSLSAKNNNSIILNGNTGTIQGAEIIGSKITNTNAAGKETFSVKNGYMSGYGANLSSLTIRGKCIITENAELVVEGSGKFTGGVGIGCDPPAAGLAIDSNTTITGQVYVGGRDSQSRAKFAVNGTAAFTGNVGIGAEFESGYALNVGGKAKIGGDTEITGNFTVKDNGKLILSAGCLQVGNATAMKDGTPYQIAVDGPWFNKSHTLTIQNGIITSIVSGTGSGWGDEGTIAASPFVLLKNVNNGGLGQSSKIYVPTSQGSNDQAWHGGTTGWKKLGALAYVDDIKKKFNITLSGTVASSNHNYYVENGTQSYTEQGSETWVYVEGDGKTYNLLGNKCTPVKITSSHVGKYAVLVNSSTDYRYTHGGSERLHKDTKNKTKFYTAGTTKSYKTYTKAGNLSVSIAGSQDITLEPSTTNTSSIDVTVTSGTVTIT